MTQIVNAGTSPEWACRQIYCFSATTNWQEYETIQGDLFDHLLSVLPEFGLRVFQQPHRGMISRTMMQGAGIPAAPASSARPIPDPGSPDAASAGTAASAPAPAVPPGQTGANP